MSLLYSNLSLFLKRYGIDAQRLFELFRFPLTLSGNMSLWDQHDPRLELASFSGTVPTFIVNQDQVILDWNPAFQMIFGEVCQLKKNVHVSKWYQYLENFRRVESRTEEFFGEGILPIADRHRVVFKSPKYGRMVFTKIMSPLVDRYTGRILGWSISLNINSVNKRNEFFTEFYETIKHNAEMLRFAASYDGVFANSSIYQRLIDRHKKAHNEAKDFLELNARTGELSMKKIMQGARVTCTHHMVEFLRIIKLKSLTRGAKKLQIIERSINQLQKIPHNRFDGIAMVHGFYEGDDVEDVIKNAFYALKFGGTFTYSQLLGASKDKDVAHHFVSTIKQDLIAKDLFDNIKYQFNYAAETFVRIEEGRIDPRKVVEALKDAGFNIQEIKNLDYHHAFIKAVK